MFKTSDKSIETRRRIAEILRRGHRQPIPEPEPQRRLDWNLDDGENDDDGTNDPSPLGGER